MRLPASAMTPVFFLGFLAAMALSVWLDIPVLRQFLGFGFLTFVPGLLIIHILRLNKVDMTTRVVLAVGCSVAFTMFLGISMSGFLPALGIERPLSTVPVLIVFGVAVIVLAALAHMRKAAPALRLGYFRLSLSEKAFLALPMLLPLLAILGMRLMNSNSNNVLLVLMLLTIALYMIAIGATRRHVPPRVYPVAIFLIAISLLLMYSLRSNHIIGSDTHREFLIFQATLSDARWSRLGFETLDTVLAVSILPTVFQVVMGLPPEFLFKILYSLFFAFAPLVIFCLSRRYVGSFCAFLAACVFMSQGIFLWTPSYARGNTAVLFFALAVLVLFDSGLPETGRRLLFVLFMASTVLSHYATAYIFFAVLTLTWVLLHLFGLLGRVVPFAPVRQLAFGKRGIAASTIALFAAIIFLWYGQMSSATFATGVRFVYASLTNWAFETREVTVETVMGRTLSTSSFPQLLELVSSWAMIILIGLGVVFTFLRKRGLTSLDARHKRGAEQIEPEYLVMAGICCLLLVVTIVFPYVSIYAGAARIFFQMVVLLSTFSIIGGVVLAARIRLNVAHWIVLAALVPQFLSTTGAAGLPFEHHRSITLSSEGPLYESMYVHDQDSYAAKWLAQHILGAETVYASGLGKDVLTSQGMIPYDRISDRLGDYSGVVASLYVRSVDLGEYDVLTLQPTLFRGRGNIYDSGGAQVWR